MLPSTIWRVPTLLGASAIFAATPHPVSEKNRAVVAMIVAGAGRFMFSPSVAYMPAVSRPPYNSRLMALWNDKGQRVDSTGKVLTPERAARSDEDSERVRQNALRLALKYPHLAPKPR
jgi:hypothetical protein